MFASRQRHTWMAQDILEHRGSIEWNFGVGQKDLDLLRELQNNANERRQLIQNLSQSSRGWPAPI